MRANRRGAPSIPDSRVGDAAVSLGAIPVSCRLPCSARPGRVDRGRCLGAWLPAPRLLARLINLTHRSSRGPSAAAERQPVGHASAPGMAQVRIISVPPGEAPLDVRRAWVGVIVPLPADHPEKPVRVLTSGVLTAPRTLLGRIWSRLTGRTQWWTGYTLEGVDCMDALTRSSPSAAQWWRDNTPIILQPGYRLVFPSDSCQLLRDSRMPNTAWKPTIAPKRVIAAQCQRR